ncbi:MAG: hypothetical protein ACE5EE_11345, partial [Fidelibacterota bacterium]
NKMAMFHKLSELDIIKTFYTCPVKSPAPYPETLPDIVTPFPTGPAFLITGQAGQVALAIYYDCLLVGRQGGYSHLTPNRVLKYE